MAEGTGNAHISALGNSGLVDYLLASHMGRVCLQAETFLGMPCITPEIVRHSTVQKDRQNCDYQTAQIVELLILGSKPPVSEKPFGDDRAVPTPDSFYRNEHKSCFALLEILRYWDIDVAG